MRPRACRTPRGADTERSCASRDHSSSSPCCWRSRPRRARTTRPSRITATPAAQLAGADINRALAVAGIWRARPHPTCPSSCRRPGAARSARPTTRSTPPSRRARADQGGLRLRERPDRQLRRVARHAAGRSRARAVPGLQTGGPRALRFDLGTSAAPSTSTSRPSRCRSPAATTSTRVRSPATSTASRRGRPRPSRRRPARPLRLADGPDRRAPTVGHRAGQRRRPAARATHNAGGLMPTMWTTRAPAGALRAGSRPRCCTR